MTTPAPPRISRALIRICTAPEDRDFLLDDLDERFVEIAQTRTPRVARRWYRGQAASALFWAVMPDPAILHRRSWTGLEDDLRTSLRTFRRSPWYSLGVSGTLAIALLATALVGAVVWRVWLAPMSYPDPARVVRLYEIEPMEGTVGAAITARRHAFSPPLVEELRQNSWRALSGVSAFLRGPMKVDLGGDLQTLQRFTLSPNGFALLGIAPTLGRLPVATESEVLLSERFWRSELGADPRVVGSHLGAGSLAPMVVGVATLPAGFPGRADVVNVITWTENQDQEDLRAARFIDAIARVRPGHTLDEAQAELGAFLTDVSRAHPIEHGWSLQAVVLSSDLLAPFREVLALLAATCATFLLLAAVNVLGLVVARRVDRHGDQGIRVALGASEARLLRTSALEGMVLAAAGSMAAVVVAAWLVEPMRALIPRGVPRVGEIAMTPGVASSAVGVGLFLGTLVGVGGWLLTRGVRPAVGRSVAVNRRNGVGRQVLIASQVALTTVLAAGTVALVQRAVTLRGLDLGFEGRNVAVTTLYGGTGPTRFPGQLAYKQVLDALHARGTAAAMGFNLPMSGEDKDLPTFPILPASSSDQVFYQLHPVSPEYFSVLGISRLAGRVFGPSDDATAEHVVVVSEAFVDHFYGRGVPPSKVIGETLKPVALLGEARIVGVVASTRQHGPDTPGMPDIYIPFAQQHTLQVAHLLIRGSPAEAHAALSGVVPQVDSSMRWEVPTDYAEYLRQWFAPLRLQISTIAVLGALGLILAVLGLYSAVAYNVASRRREIGIRKAVGAAEPQLVGLVMLLGLGPTAAGMLVGLGAWYGLHPWMPSLIGGAGRGGALLPTVVALVIGGSCAMATLVPALRAARVDPVGTLRPD